MTAQRLVRGSKARIIASLCAIIFFIGLLVLFQKSQSQLDNVRSNYKVCLQEHDSLSTQLKVIVDYKNRLEKSLQAEKTEHKQTRTELESRINDEKTRRDKTSQEANMRFQSLQQHFKLLQTKHEDLKEKSEKSDDEINKLKLKITELQEQLKQSKIDKDKSLENLKSKYIKLEIENERLIDELKKSKNDYSKWENDINHLTKENHQLKNELASIKSKNNFVNDIDKHEDTINSPHDIDEQKIPSTVIRKFDKQVEISPDVYQIKIKTDNSVGQPDANNVPQIDTPNNGDLFDHQNNLVLKQPSKPSKSTTKSNSISAANLNNVLPLLVPTVTPTTKNNTKSDKYNDFNAINNNNNNNNNVLPLPNNVDDQKVAVQSHKKLPPGVVPVPKQELQKHDESQPKNEKLDDKNGIPEEINLALPNRYRNNIIESELAKEIIKETKPEQKAINLQNEPELNMGVDINQQDNAAMEVIDQPKNPVQDDSLRLMDDNLGAGLEPNDEKLHEIEHVLNGKDPVVQLLENRKQKKSHINRGDGPENGALKAPPGGAPYENEGDYDKEGQKEDLQIEEAEPEGEEDDDGDDYDDHLVARQKEPAVRN